MHALILAFFILPTILSFRLNAVIHQKLHLQASAEEPAPTIKLFSQTIPATPYPHIPPQPSSNPTRRRKPRKYWNSVANIRSELFEFWKNLNCEIDISKPPIPSEHILNALGRNDLRHCIVTNGGRESLSDKLGGAPIISGKWVEAREEGIVWWLCYEGNKSRVFDLDGTLIPRKRLPRKEEEGDIPENWVSEHSASPSRPPRNLSGSPFYESSWTNYESNTAYKYWKDRSSRKRWGYWHYDNKGERKSIQRNSDMLPETFLRELYNFNKAFNDFSGRPPHWMPRLASFRENGRDDIYAAVYRFGGTREICKKIGLVEFEEWNYFDEFYNGLCIELREYLEIYAPSLSEKRSMPSLSSIRENGYTSLYNKIRRFGGLRNVAYRLGLEYKLKSKPTSSTSSSMTQDYGPFSLDFACDLLDFVMAQQRRISPDHFSQTVRDISLDGSISMPTKAELIELGGEKGKKLDTLIGEFGGYEVVARRLQLGIRKVYLN